MAGDARVAVVTGGASRGGEGLGAAIARYFAAQGDKVAIWDVEHGAAERVAAEIVDSGGCATAFEVDLASAASVEAAAVSTKASMGSPTVLVNSAAVRDQRPLLSLEPGDWRRVMAINIDGPFYTTRFVGQQMVEAGGGVIVNVGSPSGMQAHPARAAYVASKHALVGLTRAAAMDLGPHGVRVNCIAAFGGNSFATGNPPVLPRRDISDKAAPISEVSSLNDAAGLIYFFTTPATAFVTGAFFVADGGLHIVGDPDWRYKLGLLEEYYGAPGAGRPVDLEV